MKPAFLALALLFGMANLSSSVGADPGHKRPRLTVMKWQDPPVTSSTGECEEQGTCEDEILIVKAHDPNSSITEVEVWFSEDDDAGPLVYAHTYCLQGKAAGKPARLEIPGSYSEPGTYTVAAVAYSHKRCLGHESGDGHRSLHSKVKRLETVVEESPG